ncbi:MAG: AAA family ATPase, partial [Candidatus Dormibacteria bacterium]
MISQLWEREAALAALSTLLDGVRAGRGGTVFLVGEAGLGKTTLLDRAVAGASGLRMGRAEATAAEASLPFGLIRMALAGLGGAAVLDEAGVADAQAARAARFYRSLRWLTEAAGEGPLLVAVDDMHWADPDSLDLLGVLCRRLAGLPVAVVATLRRWPPAAGELAGELASAGQAVVAELVPLSPEGGAGLLEDLLGAELPVDQAGEMWRACGGNPLLLQLAAGSLAAGRERPRLGPQAGLGRRMLLARFAGVGNSASRYAQAAAIFGPQFRPGLVGPLAGLAEPDSTAALQALCAAGLLVAPAPGWAAFVHPLFAEALAEDAPDLVRARLHAGAFRLLVAAGVDPSEAAEHAVAASLVGDPQAVAVLERAGRAALAQGALGAATAHLSHAAELAGAEPPAHLLLTLADAQLTAGDAAGSAQIARGLLSRRDVIPAERVRALSVLAGSAYIRSDQAGADAYLDEAFQMAQGVAGVVDVLVDHVFVSWVSAQGPRRSLAVLARIRSMPPVADPRLRLHLEAAWGSAVLLSGDPAGIEPLRAAAALALRDQASTGASFWSWGAVFTYANMAKYLERFDEAIQLFTAGFAAAERAGAPAAIGAFVVAHQDTLCRLGRLAEAAQLVARGGALADFGAPVGPFLRLAAAHLAWEAGRSEEAADLCELAEAGVPPGPGGVPVLWLWLWLVRAQRHLAVGQPDAACALIGRVRELASSAGVLEPCVVPWAGVAIVAYMAADRVAEAKAVVEELEAVAEPLPCRWPRAVAAVGRALLAERAGDPDAAEGEFLRALGLHAKVAMPLAEADTLIRYGAFLRRRGAPSRARAPLARALQLAEGCGAGRLAGAAAAELAACGGRR